MRNDHHPMIAALALAPALLLGPVANADPGEGRAARSQTVFLGMSVGAGLARIGQAGLSIEPRGGVEYDAVFGFGLTRRWAAGVELATWQPLNLDGNPSHVHLFALRVEYTFGPEDGLVMGTSLGMGVGDGSQTKRLGEGGGLQLGYRWPVGRGVTLAAEAGVHGVLYADGSAVIPFAALQLRFYGRSALWDRPSPRGP